MREFVVTLRVVDKSEQQDLTGDEVLAVLGDVLEAGDGPILDAILTIVEAREIK